MQKKEALKITAVILVIFIIIWQTIMIVKLAKLSSYWAGQAMESERKVLDIQKTCYEYEQEIIALYNE